MPPPGTVRPGRMSGALGRGRRLQCVWRCAVACHGGGGRYGREDTRPAMSRRFDDAPPAQTAGGASCVAGLPEGGLCVAGLSVTGAFRVGHRNTFTPRRGGGGAMYRLSRSLATRLRRAAFPAPRPQPPVVPADPWIRLERALTAPADPDHVTRQRELVEENLRISVTLLGQQGATVLARVLAACAGDATGSSAPACIALELARRAGLRS